MKQALLSLITLPLIWSCSSQSPTPPPATKTENANAEVITLTPFSRVLETNFRGQLVMGEGEAWFTPCGFDNGFKLLFDPSLEMIYNKVSPTAFEPAYVEFAGEIVPSNNQKEATLRVDRVHHMALSKTSPQCEKAVTGFHFKARGINPFWNALVSGQTLTFSTQSSSQNYKVNLSKFETTQRNTIRAENDNGFVLTLNLRPGDCFSGNGNVYWGYQAKADAAWGKYQGCAEPAWPEVDMTMIGHYMGTPPGHSHEKFELNLSDDYSATLITQSHHGVIKESGFWKSNNPTEVAIFLTRSGDDSIAKEIIFKRKGLALFAEQMNNAGQVTQFGYEEIRLDKMTAGGEEFLVPLKAPTTTQRPLTPEAVGPAGLDRQVQAAVSQYFRYHRTHPGNTKFSAVKYDLNGDGIDDALVQLNWCSKQGCVLLVMEGTGKGYEFVSRTENVASPLYVLSTADHAWLQLQTKVSKQWKTLYYNGVSYPDNTLGLRRENSVDTSTGVVLFPQGRPTQWYAIP